MREYEVAIATVARSTAPVANRCDAIAYCREDYTQELALVATQARERFRENHGFCESQERRYVLKSLWNHARDRKLSGGRASEGYVRNHQAVRVEAEVSGPINPFPRYEAREYLRRLVATLEPAEIALIQRLAEAGGHLPRAHDCVNDGSLRTFRRTVDRLRQRVADLRL